MIGHEFIVYFVVIRKTGNGSQQHDMIYLLFGQTDGGCEIGLSGII